MKNGMRTYVIVFFVFVFISALSQEPIAVNIENRPSSGGMHPAFEVMVPQVTSEEAIDLIKKAISQKELFKKGPKMEKVEDEWQIEGVVINDITPKPLDVTTQVSSFPGHIYVRFFFQNNGEFLGAEKDTLPETEAALIFVHNLGVNLYRFAVEKELKEKEKELQKLENDMDRLTRKNNNLDEKIEDAVTDQKDFDDEVDSQKKDLRQAKRSDVSHEELDEIKKDLKSAEKDLKKAKKDEEKFERKMDKNEREQQEITLEIERQKEVIGNVKVKLDNIR